MTGSINRIPLFSGALLLAMIAVSSPAQAIPTITCHCFTDRSYDPAKPALADPYFLAMTQNTLFALVFKIDKKTVVIKKQQGVSSDDLWIAYWIAAKSGQSPEGLLQAKTDKGTWPEVIGHVRLPPNTLGVGVSGALNAGASAAVLAAAVVDDLFRSYRLLSDGDVAALRQAGANNQELILSTVIATKTRKPARQFYHEVTTGATTWGTLLRQAKIDPGNMQTEIAAILEVQSIK
jgi:hypothetical protein